MSKGMLANDITESIVIGKAYLKAVYAANNNAAVRYLQVFNQTTAPVDNDVPMFSFAIPIAGSVEKNMAFFGERGVPFPLGIAIGISVSKDTYQGGATPTDHVMDWNIS